MAKQYAISGQFMLAVGAFVEVIISFIAAVLVVGPGGELVSVIILFILFFAVLFIPLSLLTRPLIEREAVDKYLDGMEKKIRHWSFHQQDIQNLQRLKRHLVEKRGRFYRSITMRTALILTEMERLEKARSSFYWEADEGIRH